MTRSRQIGLSVVIFVLALVGYGCIFGGALFAVEAWWIGWKSPIVKMVPSALPDNSIDSRASRTLQTRGYEFQVPWDDIDESETVRSGRSLTLRSSAPRWTITSLSSETQGVTAGPGVSPFNYRFRRQMLETTPSQVRPWSVREVAGRKAGQLVLKSIVLPRGAESGIYYVAVGSFEGFQFGDPRTSSFITVELFDEAGEVSFLIGQKVENGKTSVTQREINRVIQSLRRVQ